MLIEALLAATLITLLSLIGALLFGHDKRLTGIERFAVPAAVGVFMGLVLFELLPETYEVAGGLGGIVIGIGFISFYILSTYLHRKHHGEVDEDCNRKNAATMVLIGDAIHNLSDGFILGTAFLINPAVGVATAIGLALHEIPQEIVEFGILLRGGYTKKQAALLNLLSASTIILGTGIVLFVFEHAAEYVWIFVAIAAGNLLYLAASELLPGVHGNLPHYGSVWHAVAAIIIGFIFITTTIYYGHELSGEEHDEQATTTNYLFQNVS